MKKVTLKSVHGGLIRIGVAAAVWALCLSAAQTRASGDPSAGDIQTWDCLLSGGGEKGIAYITFTVDGNITGTELLAPSVSSLNSGSSSGGRQIPPGRGEFGGSSSGGGTVTSTNSTSSSTNSTGGTNVVLFGSGPIQGVWQFDAKSNIVGSFVRLAAPDDADVSFTGTVSSGSKPHLTLKAAFGTSRGTYSGVVALTETSLKFPDPTTNPWFGFKLADGQKTFEQFTLSPDISGVLGVYDLSGTGPDYQTIGKCLVSSQGRIGFSVLETNSVTKSSTLRATMGPFSNTSTAINTHTTGVQEDLNAVTFNPTLLK